MKEELLTQIWDLTAAGLIQRLTSGEATAQDLNIARQFLKDHNVNVDAPEESPLATISEILPFKKTEEEEQKLG